MATGELVSLSEQQLVDCDHEVSIVLAVDFLNLINSILISIYIYVLSAIDDVLLVFLYILSCCFEYMFSSV